MPFVKTIPTDESGQGGKTVTASTTTEPETGAQKQGGEQQLVIYDATTCYLYNKGYFVTELTSDETLSLSLINRKVKEAFLTITATDNDGVSGEFLIDILKSSRKLDLKIENNKPTLYINLKVWARISDANSSESINIVANLGKLNDNMKFKTEKFITDNLVSVINKSKESNSDILEIKNLLYKYHTARYKALNLTALEDLQYKITVTCLNYL